MKQRESSAISNKKNDVLTLSAFYKQTKPKKKKLSVNFNIIDGFEFCQKISAELYDTTMTYI